MNRSVYSYSQIRREKGFLYSNNKIDDRLRAPEKSNRIAININTE